MPGNRVGLYARDHIEGINLKDPLPDGLKM